MTDGIKTAQKQLTDHFFKKVKSLNFGIAFKRNNPGGLLTQEEIERFLKIYLSKYSLLRLIRLKLITERLIDEEMLPEFSFCDIF